MTPAPLLAPKLREAVRLLLVKTEEVRCCCGVVALRANAPPTSPKTENRRAIAYWAPNDPVTVWVEVPNVSASSSSDSDDDKADEPDEDRAYAQRGET